VLLERIKKERTKEPKPAMRGRKVEEADMVKGLTGKVDAVDVEPADDNSVQRTEAA
jgi:hypothetical protein